MAVNPKLLRRALMFTDLSTADVNAVAEIAGMKWFDRGDHLHQQGDMAESFYVVFDGAIKVSRVTDAGRAMVVDFRGPGHVIGGRAILNEGCHADAAIALEDVLVAVIPVRGAGKLMSSRPGAAISLARHLAQRLEAREAKVASLSTKRVHQRLAEGLMELAGIFGAAVDGVTVINARLTQGELADWIGTTRETTSTLLNGLRRAGFIDIVGRRIHILDPASVAAYAQCEDLPADLADLVGTAIREPAEPFARSA